MWKRQGGDCLERGKAGIWERGRVECQREAARECGKEAVFKKSF